MKEILTLILVIITIFLFGIVYIIISEVRAWNKGICPGCGKKLKRVPDYMEDGEKWKCECGYTCLVHHWIVYSIIKKKY